jgi:hypothetical protein
VVNIKRLHLILALFIAALSLTNLVILLPQRNIQKKELVLSSDTSSDGNDGTTTTFTPTPTYIYDDSTTSGDDATQNHTPTPITTDDPYNDNTTTYFTPTATPPYTGDNETTTTAATDRLASVDEVTLSCIKSRLTSSEYEKLRYLTPTNNNEEETLSLLKEKVKVCFESYSEAVKIGEAAQEIKKLPGEVSSCIIDKIGEQAFNEINSGLREPTREEKEKTYGCYPETQQQITYISNDEELGSDVIGCIILALGKNRYREIVNSNLAMTVVEREQVQRCFGKSPHPLTKQPQNVLDTKIDNCLNEKISSDRLSQIYSGKVQTTKEEISLATYCFGGINSVQKKLLPAPPQEVPFLEEKPEKITITSDFLEKKMISDILSDENIVLSGNAPANSLVDLYIFSEPVVVTTQTDENGDWVYHLNEPLEDGQHIVYAVAADNSGERVRSSIYNIEVLASENENSTLLQEEKASETPSKYLSFAVIIIIMSTLVGSIGIYWGIRTINSKKNESEPSNGKSETYTRS